MPEHSPHDALAYSFAEQWPHLGKQIGHLTALGAGDGLLTDNRDANLARAACMMVVALQIHPQLLLAEIAARTT